MTDLQKPAEGIIPMSGDWPVSAFGTWAALCACFLITTAPSATAEAEAVPRIVVTCDGPVEMTRREPGRTRLVLSGGVRVERGELTLSARRGRLEVGRESGTPEEVLLEGDVVIDSPRFAAKAGAARLRRAEAEPEGGGAPADGFTITLERRDRTAIDLRVGAVRVTCGGPVVYRESSGEIAVAGRLRAETGTFVVRAESGVLTLDRSAPGPGKGGAESSGTHPVEGTRPVADRETEAPPPLPFGVERIELEGPVDIHTSPAEGPERRGRASRAIYIGAEDVIVLLGDPGPEIESEGVLLTAPQEMRMYITENRIEAPKGRMRAVIGPRRPDNNSEQEPQMNTDEH